tara:strand:- start:1433 stop:1750 length:318 start_codon:yes stop_codon:yes gene_type:complete
MVIKMKLTKKNVTRATLVLVALTSGAAFAAATATGTTAAGFDGILDEVRGWLVGAPGKIVAVLAFGAAMFNVVKQNFIAAIGAFLGALMMAFAGDVIDIIFSAGI